MGSDLMRYKVDVLGSIGVALKAKGGLDEVPFGQGCFRTPLGLMGYEEFRHYILQVQRDGHSLPHLAT